MLIRSVCAVQANHVHLCFGTTASQLLTTHPLGAMGLSISDVVSCDDLNPRLCALRQQSARWAPSSVGAWVPVGCDRAIEPRPRLPLRSLAPILCPTDRSTSALHAQLINNCQRQVHAWRSGSRFMQTTAWLPWHPRRVIEVVLKMKEVGAKEQCSSNPSDQGRAKQSFVPYERHRRTEEPGPRSGA